MIYEYVCPDGHVIEAHVKMNGEGAPRSCTEEMGYVKSTGVPPGAVRIYSLLCGKPLKRILSAPSPFFPGAGSWRGA